MSQNIALTISLGGTQKAVSNIAQLEEAVRQAKDELRNLEIGSVAFNKLANDVKVAENRVKDLNKQIEGKDLEARIGDFGKLGGAIGASFASASAAIQLFGAESEDSLKAVTQAQAALTLALGAKAAAEGAVVVKQYASIAATNLQAAATAALTQTTRAFFATLLTNPLTLVLVGLTALATAMYAFGDSAEEASDQVSDLNKETKDLAVLQTKAAQSALAETSQLKKFQTIVNDTNQSLRVRKAAYEELQKLVPTLKNLTLEQAQAEGVLNEYIGEQVRLIELRAKAKALEEVVLKEEQDKLEEKRKKLERDIIQLEVDRAQAVENIRKGGGTIEFINREIAAYDKRIKTLRDSFKPSEELAKITKEILDIQGKQTQVINTQTKAIDDNNNAKGKALQLELATQVIQGKVRLAYLSTLLAVEKFTQTDVDAVKKLEEKIALQKQYIQTLGDQQTREQKRQQVIQANTVIEDKAFKIFENTRKAYEDFLVGVKSGDIPVEKFGEAFAKVSSAVNNSKAALTGIVNPQTIEEFRKYESNLKAIAEIYQKIGKLGDPLYTTFKDFETAVEGSNDALLSAEQRATNAAKAEELLPKVIEQYIDKQKQSLGVTKLTEQQTQNLTNQILLYIDRLGLAKVETKNFENGVDGAAKKIGELNAEIEKNIPLVEKAFNREKLNDLGKFIQELAQGTQQILGAVQQTISDFYNAQFDVLEKRNQRIQEGIIGNTEEAAKKRIEAEKSYQAERARLEKQAAKLQLKISLGQSIANTAEAIGRVFATLGGNPIAIAVAAAVAATSAAQTAIIGQQLAAIDSYKRGGIMRKQGGGFVTGPAHEFGGVKFQGGGVELEGNEAVINRVSTINYMGLLDQINQAGGGRPISSLANESRLIEAIAKQRNTPIRAYVVESDITAKQETARRLERLSQF